MESNVYNTTFHETDNTNNNVFHEWENILKKMKNKNNIKHV